MNNKFETYKEMMYTLTSKHIDCEDFDFSECTAYDISVVFKIDRANVSRTLNNLYKHMVLTKIIGRPTIFVSRDALIEKLKLESLPHTFDSIDQFNKYLKISKDRKSSTINNVEFIGNSINESFYSIYQEVTTLFSNDFFNSIPIIIVGNKGTGKKFFIERLYEHLLLNKKNYKNSRFLRLNYLGNIEKFEQQLTSYAIENIKLISVEVFNKLSLDDFNIIEQLIHNIYYNNNLDSPSIIFSATPQFISDDFQSFTPYSYRILDLEDRSLDEKIRLIVYFLNDLVHKFDIEITIKRSVIFQLLINSYPLNVLQLKNEISYALSTSISNREYYNQLFLSSINIDRPSSSLSKASITLISDKINDLFPESFTVTKDTPYKIIDEMYINSLYINQTNTKVKLFDYLKKVILINSPKLSITEKNDSRLYNVLFNTLQFYKFDLNEGICNLLYGYIKLIKNDQLDLSQFDLEFLIPSDINKSIKLFIDRLESNLNVSFTKEYILFINMFFYVYEKMSSNSKMANIMISSNPDYANKIAGYFNYISNSTSYYVIDSSNTPNEFTNEFILSTIESLSMISSDKDIMIFTEDTPLDKLSALFVTKLNRSLMSISPISFTMIHYTLDLLNEDYSNSFTYTKSLLNKKREITTINKTPASDYQSKYLSQMFDSHSFSSYFSKINLPVATKLLYFILFNISLKLKFDITNEILVDFIFEALHSLQENNKSTLQNNMKTPIFSALMNEFTLNSDFVNIIHNQQAVYNLSKQLEINISKQAS